MLDLSPHYEQSAAAQAIAPTVRGGIHTGQGEEDEPVDDEYGPEDGNVEDDEPGAEEADGNGAGGGEPELELGQAADEGAELLVLLGGQAAGGAVLHVVVSGLIGGVELGLEEGEEEVEQVDAEGVCD